MFLSLKVLCEATLSRLMPKRIQVDNGAEFVAKEVDVWAYANGVAVEFSRPGKPTDNLNCSFHNKC